MGEKIRLNSLLFKVGIYTFKFEIQMKFTFCGNNGGFEEVNIVPKLIL